MDWISKMADIVVHQQKQEITNLIDPNCVRINDTSSGGPLVCQ